VPFVAISRSKTKNRSDSDAKETAITSRAAPTDKSGSERVSSLSEIEPERDRVVFAACRQVAQAAIAQVASCEACNPDAGWPFEAILDRGMLFSGVHTDYFMPEPPPCPRCKATMTEKTLVEWV